MSNADAQLKPIKIGLIVGETSGAILALGMVKEILLQYPNCTIEGIGSEELKGLGMRSLFDMNELSVMGLVEVIKHLPRLLHIRKTVVKHFLQSPPDVFIGVDAPDFNLRVEKELKAAGIPTIHYVSPTVWAWREKRIFKIAKATNLVLGVFPFEKQIYDKYKLPFKFVGHTMADNIPIETPKQNARDALNLEASVKEIPILALLPGSREREVASLLEVFLESYQLLKQKKDKLKVLIPAVNEAREAQIKQIIEQYINNNELNGMDFKQGLIVSRKSARDIILASDVVLLASGTAALEAMLCKRPMVVAYKMSSLSYLMMKRLYKPKYFALPNILANTKLVPEFLQEDVNPQTLAEQLDKVWGESAEKNHELIENFTKIHLSLKQDADKSSAKAVLELIAANNNA